MLQKGGGFSHPETGRSVVEVAFELNFPEFSRYPAVEPGGGLVHIGIV